jgi:hypothetical protein
VNYGLWHSVIIILDRRNYWTVCSTFVQTTSLGNTCRPCPTPLCLMRAIRLKRKGCYTGSGIFSSCICGWFGMSIAVNRLESVQQAKVGRIINFQRLTYEQKLPDFLLNLEQTRNTQPVLLPSSLFQNPRGFPMVG